MEKLKLIKKTNQDQLTVIEDNLIIVDDIDAHTSEKLNTTSSLIARRGEGEYYKRGYWLNPDVDWHIGLDSLGKTVLIPTKRI